MVPMGGDLASATWSISLIELLRWGGRRGRYTPVGGCTSAASSSGKAESGNYLVRSSPLEPSRNPLGVSHSIRKL